MTIPHMLPARESILLGMVYHWGYHMIAILVGKPVLRGAAFGKILQAGGNGRRGSSGRNQQLTQIWGLEYSHLSKITILTQKA